MVVAASYDKPGGATALVEAGADPVGRGFAVPDGTALLSRVLPVLLVVGLVLLVTVGDNPAGFVALPPVFVLTARFGPHRRL